MSFVICLGWVTAGSALLCTNLAMTRRISHFGRNWMWLVTIGVHLGSSLVTLIRWEWWKKGREGALVEERSVVSNCSLIIMAYWSLISQGRDFPSPTRAIFQHSARLVIFSKLGLVWIVPWVLGDFIGLFDHRVSLLQKMSILKPFRFNPIGSKKMNSWAHLKVGRKRKI